MHWEIYTMGGGETLKDVFNAVASLTSSQNYLTLIKMITAAGLIWGLFVTAFNNNFKILTNWTMSFVLILSIMLVPKCTVVIHDVLDRNKPYHHIDKVPVGLGIFASLTSTVGYNLTKIIESLFAHPKDLMYHKYGMMFGSRLIANTATLGIDDSNFAQSINSFTKQCIFYDILLKKYSLNDLVTSNNIWSLVSENPSPARAFELLVTTISPETKKEKTDRQIVTCKDGVRILNAGWARQIDNSSNTLASALSVFGDFSGDSVSKQSPLKAPILGALPITYDKFFQISKSYKDIIHQNMMIRAIDSAGADFSNIGSASNIYTDIRANLQTKVAFNASRVQAESWLPVLRTTLEILFYGAFPMVFLMFMLPMGGKVLEGYFATFLWLQSWGPLYAILNRIMSGDATNAMAIYANKGITIANHAAITNAHENLMASAGNMVWAIPIISLGLVKGMAMAFNGAAHSMLAIPQAATNAAAAEVSTGNISLGNTNIGNSSFANTNGFKLNDSPSIDSGRMQVVNSSGGTTSFNSQGEYASNQSGAITSIPNISMKLSDAHSSQLNHSANQSEQAGYSASENASHSRAHAMEKAISNMNSHQVSESSTNDYMKSWSSSEKEAWNRTEQLANDFAQSHRIDTNTAAKILASGSMGKDASFIKGALGASVEIGRNESNAIDDVKRFSEQNNMHKDFAVIQDAVARKGFSESDSHSKNIQNSVNDSLREADQYDKQQRAHFDKAQGFRQEAQYVQSNSLSIDRELTNQFVHWASDQSDIHGHKLGHERVVGMLSSPHQNDISNSQRLMNDFLSQTDVSSSIQKDYAANKGSVVGNNDNANKAYDSHKAQVSKDVGSISNDNQDEVGFDNNYVKGMVGGSREATLEQIQASSKEIKKPE